MGAGPRLPREEVHRLKPVVDQFPCVNRVAQNPPHPFGIPIAAPFCGDAQGSEPQGDGPAADALPGVPMEDPLHRLPLRRVDPQGEGVHPVIAVEFRRDPAPLCPFLLAELHPAGKVGALLLGQRPKNGEDKLRVPQKPLAPREEPHGNPQGFEPPESV